MDKLKVSIQSEVSINPNQVADLFCSMDGGEQADFFNMVAENVAKWDNPFVLQLQAIIDTEKLTLGGNQIMREIGEYAYGLTSKKAKEVDNFIEDLGF